MPLDMQSLPFELAQDDMALLERLLDWFLQPGGAFDGEPATLHRVRLGFGLALGRRCGQMGTWHDAHGRLRGWCSWLRTDARGLALLRDVPLDDLVQRALTFPVCAGPHVYVLDTAVAPDAPRCVYRDLYKQARRHNDDALTISGHLCKRDGRRMWHQRRIDGGLLRAPAHARAA